MLNTNPDHNGRRLIHERRAYKINEAADIIGVTPVSIRRMINRGS